MSTEKKQKKILIVDDSPTQLKKVDLILSGAGYKVVTAVNGVDGTNKAYSEAPDLIVSDILMPELNGYQFCRLIKNDLLRQHIPVILLTNLGEEQDKFWGMESGADAYIVKENEHTELIPKIEALLERPAAETTEAPKPEDVKGGDSRHKTRANYMLDHLVMESTISNKTREIIKNTRSSPQVINNFFDLLSKLVDYNLAQLLIRSKQYYYCNMDIRGENGLSPQIVEFTNDKVSRQVKIGIADNCQKVYIVNEENIKRSGDGHLRATMDFPVLVDDATMAVIAVHHVQPDAYRAESEQTLRVISQQLGAIIKYFLALEKNTRWRQWYAHLLSDKINSRFKRISSSSRLLADKLAGTIEETQWQSLHQVVETAEESQQMIVDIVSSLNVPKK